jgi:hypothetical protein
MGKRRTSAEHYIEKEARRSVGTNVTAELNRDLIDTFPTRDSL